MEIKKKIEKRIAEFITKNYPKISLKKIATKITYPPKLTMGDYAINTPFILAKIEKINIKEVGETLAANLTQSDFCEKAEFVHPGFINITLSSTYFNSLLTCNPRNNQVKRKKKYYLEYVSANPTGGLHLGHLRIGLASRIYGRLVEFLGGEIYKEFLINDGGTQIEILKDSARTLLQTSFKNTDVTYYSQELADCCQQYWTKKNNDDITNEFLTSYFVNEIKKDMELMKIETRDISFVNEEVFASANKSSIFYQNLIQKGICYWKDQAIFLKTTKVGDDEDRVVIKANGYRTYVGTDILYHLYKFQKEADRYINFWGADQQGNESTLRYALKLLNCHDEQKLHIIYAQLVKLKIQNKIQKMSKRLGTNILIKELIKIANLDYVSHYMMSKSLNTTLVIDLIKIKQKDKINTLYYLQYSYARICQLLNKGEAWLQQYEQEKGTKKQSYQFSAKERRLMLLSFDYLTILYQVEKTYEIHKLYQYLYDLCELFHTYYQNERILSTKNRAYIIKIKLNIVKLIKEIISIMFEILDIEKRSKMDNFNNDNKEDRNER